jgi:hypothetical protein
MQQILAIAGLSWKAAFRYRLFWVIAALLVCAVVGLPLLIKDDGTAEGFAQILLTYTLSAVTGLLGLCTLWLACGTLARDFEECQIQMVAVKPIARWQIWLGKWLGILSLNAVLLAFSGLAIYGMLQYRARSLPAAEREKLENVVLVARASAREESQEPLIRQETERRFKERMEKGRVEEANPSAVRQQIYEQCKAELQVVAPGASRVWKIHLGAAKDYLKDQPLFLRVKFNTPQIYNATATYKAAWIIGTPKKTSIWRENAMLSPDSFHELVIPPNLLDDNGDLLILFGNPNDNSLLFTLDEGLEVLYKQGGFGGNFARALCIILCWMALLAALGLAAASLLSFPVAAFFSLALLVISLCGSTMGDAVSTGTIMGWDSEKGVAGHSPVDIVIIPLFRAMLSLINLVQQYSPVQSLTEGRSITWTQLGLAAGQIVFLLSGILAVTGIVIFNRRELATAQGAH